MRGLQQRVRYRRSRMRRMTRSGLWRKEESRCCERTARRVLRLKGCIAPGDELVSTAWFRTITVVTYGNSQVAICICRDGVDDGSES